MGLTDPENFNYADMEAECGDAVLPEQVVGHDSKSGKRSWKEVADEAVQKLTFEQLQAYKHIMGALGLTDEPAEKFNKKVFISGDGGTGKIIFYL